MHNLIPALLEMRADWKAPLYHVDTGHLHYGVFLELLLKQTSDAFINLEDEGMLPPGITLGMKRFFPCEICKLQDTHCESCQAKAKENLDSVLHREQDCEDCEEKKSQLGVYTPATHCEECIPVVTHTKQGICVVVKGHGKNLLMDLIPVLPSPQDAKKEPLMKLYKMITTSLLSEKPPGWKKAFMAYFTKDKVIPEEMQELSQVKFDDVKASSVKRVSQSYGKSKRRSKGKGLPSSYAYNIRNTFKAEQNGKGSLQGNGKRKKKTLAKGKDKQKLRYILVKVLHYGPEPNYQVRATQSVNAIAQFSEVKADRLTFQEVKTLTKLLRVENLASYLVKKVFLSPTNMDRLPSAEASKGREDRVSLYRTLVSPEIRHFFSSRVKFDINSIFQEGIIPLIPKGT